MRPFDLTGDGHAHVHGWQKLCWATGEGNGVPVGTWAAAWRWGRQLESLPGTHADWMFHQCCEGKKAEYFSTTERGRERDLLLAPFSFFLFFFTPSSLSPTRQIISASKDAALHALVLFVSFNKHPCHTMQQCGEAGEGGLAPDWQGENVWGSVSASYRSESSRSGKHLTVCSGFLSLSF